MSKFDAYGGAPFEEPDYEDSREIVAEYTQQDGLFTFKRYISLTSLEEELNADEGGDVAAQLTPDERHFFIEDESFAVETCLAGAGDDYTVEPYPGGAKITKTFPITVYKTRKTMTVNEFVGYEVESFAQWGRAVYKWTDCGPWTATLLPDGREVYYEDAEAREIKGTDLIVGVRLGSNVEGWDGELPPYYCYSREEFDKALEELEEITSNIWELANGDFFIVHKDGANIGGAQNIWGDVKIEVDERAINSKERRRLRRFIESARWNNTRRFRPGWGNRPGRFYKAVPSDGDTWKLGKTGIEVIYYEPEIMW